MTQSQQRRCSGGALSFFRSPDAGARLEAHLEVLPRGHVQAQVVVVQLVLVELLQENHDKMS